MLQYLAWRVFVGLNEEITLSFLLTGHTKFSPDWCFGLQKRKFRRTKVGCLEDIAQVVETSATVNHAQLVGAQNGEVLVPTYDWANNLTPFFKQTAWRGIKTLLHIRFTHQKPGSAFFRGAADAPEVEVDILRDTTWRPTEYELPPRFTPTGLSLERKKYLFDKIREFCPEDCKDLVCPDPELDDTTSPTYVKGTKTVLTAKQGSLSIHYHLRCYLEL